VSFVFLERSSVVRHHTAGPLGLTRFALGRTSREFLDSAYCFIAQGRRLPRDTCLAKPFDVGHLPPDRTLELSRWAGVLDHRRRDRSGGPQTIVLMPFLTLCMLLAIAHAAPCTRRGYGIGG
jgi:hypothetical protein